MNQRLASGAFVLAISLAVLGAAATAHSIPEGSLPDAAIGSAVVSVQSASSATPQVPLRSGFLDGQTTIVDESAFPVAVRIEDIGLEAPVLSVGVDDQNDFDVPQADTVGWYKYSATPGSVGTTVLAAHVDYGGKPGAFFNLEDLTIGEVLEVEMADGSVLDYRVTGSTLYDKTELPAAELFRSDGAPTLQLITCGGTFDTENRSYNGNLVVTAEPIDLA